MVSTAKETLPFEIQSSQIPFNLAEIDGARTLGKIGLNALFENQTIPAKNVASHRRLRLRKKGIRVKVRFFDQEKEKVR